MSTPEPRAVDRPPEPEVRPEDLVVAGLCLLAAVVTAAESVPRYFGRQGIGPGAFPTWVALLLAGCGLAVVVNAVRRRGLAPALDWPVGPARIRLLLAAGSMAVYLAVLPIIGFWLSSALLILFHFRVLGGYSWRVAIPTAFFSALLIAYVFGELLFMPLPPGIVGF